MSNLQKASQLLVEPETLEEVFRSAVNTSASSRLSQPEPEVLPRRNRRRPTSEYKLRILDELDRCTESGEKGAILRREGLYTSSITNWRRARNAGSLGALNRLRGRKLKYDNRDKQIQKLELELAQTKAKLHQAETIIDVQKKVSEIFGVTTPLNNESEKRT